MTVCLRIKTLKKIKQAKLAIYFVSTTSVAIVFKGQGITVL